MSRTKGSLGKQTIALKTMILNALDECGGVEYLVKQAKENPTAFLTLIGKTLPLAVDVTKTQIHVTVGLYPEEQDEQHRPEASREAVESVH